MQNDFSYINTESDLDKATQVVAERIRMNRLQIKEESKELQVAIRKTIVRKSLPWVLGATTIIIGTMVFKKWRRSRPTSRKVSQKPLSILTSALTPKSIAFTVLPLATQLLKTWLIKRRAAHPTNGQNNFRSHE